MSEISPLTLLESRVTNDTPFKERPILQNQSDNSDPKVGSALWWTYRRRVLTMTLEPLYARDHGPPPTCPFIQLTMRKSDTTLSPV